MFIVIDSYRSVVQWNIGQQLIVSAFNDCSTFEWRTRTVSGCRAAVRNRVRARSIFDTVESAWASYMGTSSECAVLGVGHGCLMDVKRQLRLDCYHRRKANAGLVWTYNNANEEESEKNARHFDGWICRWKAVESNCVNSVFAFSFYSTLEPDSNRHIWWFGENVFAERV